jgi:uncharacterized membrane protein
MNDLDLRRPEAITRRRRDRATVGVAARQLTHEPIITWTAVTCALMLFAWCVPALGFVTATAGLLLTVGIPAVQYCAKLNMPGSPRSHRVIISITLSVFTLILVGLALNTLLPLLGNDRPLARLPVAIGVLVENVALILWRSHRLPVWRRPEIQIKPAFLALLMTLGAALIGVIAGANRLNNGSDGVPTLGAFCLLVVVLVMTWRWRHVLTDGEIASVFYLVTLTLLLATSLRGWYITGHDIQREFHVFALTSNSDRWNISNFQDPYNACMSLTILPTMWARLLGIDDAYVFKVVAQMFFALTGPAVYLVARKQFSRTSAMLAVTVYVSFPTFFTDMPFITRQEFGFTFLAVAVLVLCSDTWSPSGRRLMFVVFGIAIVLSHYSTTYLLLITLVFGQAIWWVGQFLSSLRGRAKRRRDDVSLTPPWGRPVLGIGSVALIAAAAFVWTVPATHTSSQLSQTVRGTVETLLGRQSATQSTDVGYGLVHSKVQTPAQEISAYQAGTLKVTESDPGNYLPRALVDKYPAVAVPQPDLPLTTAGHGLAKLGISAHGLNAALRNGLAKYYQLAALLGLLILAWRYKRRRTVAPAQRELLCLSAASLVGLVAVLVLPDLSTEYGLLRAFQQALILLSPFVAEATVAIARVIARKRAGAVSILAGATVFASLSGIIPQLLGGYPAQLSLNNAGVYYNDYYLHPQDESAIAWLNAHTQKSSDVQAEIQTDRYTAYLFGASAGRTTADIFPTVVQRHAFVFLGYANVTLDQASVSVDGNTVPYRYPTSLLNRTKNIVFATDGSRIYK